ncbi:hypothetical protein [Streptomyces sp. NPDC002685]|uniref:hypothetical protein n=1 Tax=Streptomyces sp. NPDC002685 TaxID=3154540 RepID=UPI003322A15F
MAAVTTLNIPRPLSTPLRISLAGELLPAPCKSALDHLAEVVADRIEAERTQAPAEEIAAADTVVGEGVQALAETTSGSTTAILDHTAASYARAIEQAQGLIHGALDQLETAAQALALYRSAAAGKPLFNTENRRAEEDPQRSRISTVRSQLREALADIPDSID